MPFFSGTRTCTKIAFVRWLSITHWFAVFSGFAAFHTSPSGNPPGNNAIPIAITTAIAATQTRRRRQGCSAWRAVPAPDESSRRL